jgi:hypothetical protein
MHLQNAMIIAPESREPLDGVAAAIAGSEVLMQR